MPEAKSKIYVGIDVCKEKLDVCIDGMKGKPIYKNTISGIKSLIKRLQQVGETHTVVEATGGYEALIRDMFLESDLTISVVNPRCVRDFANSRNILAKTDKLDAYVIKEFGLTNHPAPQRARTQDEKRLLSLKNRRDQLVKMITQETQHLEFTPKEIEREIKRMIRSLEKQKESIEKKIAEVIQANEVFSQKQKIITSVKGVGGITATIVLCDLPELGTLPKKALSALVGLAPFCSESGKIKKKKQIKAGRAQVRKAFYMCALSASRSNPVIKEFYNRLLLKGKPKKVALAACAHKILGIVNVLVKKNELWENALQAS